jgi:hypothetical protein
LTATTSVLSAKAMLLMNKHIRITEIVQSNIVLKAFINHTSFID